MSDQTETTSRFQEIAKQGFLALLTGGISLIYLLIRKLPSMWDQVALDRAAWILTGRNPRTWGWIGRGWLNSLLTSFTLIPGALMISGIISLGYRHHALVQGQKFNLGFLIMGSIPVIAIFAVGTLILIWSYHSLRQLAFLTGTLIVEAFRRRKS